VEAREYFDILRRRWLSVLVIALTTLTVASLLTLAMPKKYTATTELFFAVAGESVSELAQGSSFAAKQMSSYANVATSPLVLEPVVRQLALPTTATELEKSVEASVPQNQVILEVAVTDASPRRAAEIANAVGVTLGKVAGSLSPSRQDGGEAVRATTLRIAEVPTVPSSPDIPRNLGIGLVLGLLLGIGIAILRHVLDTKVRSEQDVRALTDSPILGVVAFDKKVPSHPVILRDEPLAAPSEAVRRLRTNLQFIDAANRPKSIVISSSIPGEGKSTMAINLAVSLADTGARVILVDADLRRPSIADYAGIEGSVGLTTVLIGRADVEDVVQPMGTTTLDLLPAGQIPPNPSELLGSPAMAGLLDRLTRSYDTVLLDSPPLLPVTDAAVLSKLSGGALVIVGADRIHRPQLQETLGSLQTAGVHVLGIVLNKIDRREASTYSYESGYAPTHVDQSSMPVAFTGPKPDKDSDKSDTRAVAVTDPKPAKDSDKSDTRAVAVTDPKPAKDSDKSDPRAVVVTDPKPANDSDKSDSDVTVEMELELKEERLPAQAR
jgi:succinoglycan biosynthesis transport protein ExoP